uniref:Uncharacterized protein n=1 Tax=Anopheles farauti TaxID=69004 RepID=A0A182R0J5_9DIPT
MRYLHRGGMSEWTLLVLAVVSVTILTIPVQSQQVRSQSRAPKCILAADELESLIDLLDDIELPSSTDSEEAEEEVSSEKEYETQPVNPQCTRELRRLRHSVRLLQLRYQELKQNTTTVDARQYELMKRRYEHQKKDLTAKLDHLSTQASAQHRSQLNELKNKIKKVEKQLNSAVEELARQRQLNVNNYILLVANYIYNNQMNPAISNFDRLMTYSTDPYGSIVRKVIENGGVQTTHKLLQFLQRVNFQHQPVAGYEVLVEELIAQQALIGSKASELLKHLQVLVLARDGNQQERAVALLKRFKSNVQ